MKGIPNQAIIYKCKELNLNPIELYRELYDGKSVNFDLLCGGERINFKYNNFDVRSLKYYEEDEHKNKIYVEYEKEKYNNKNIFSEFSRKVNFLSSYEKKQIKNKEINEIIL
jgi:hypothetical protein